MSEPTVPIIDIGGRAQAPSAEVIAAVAHACEHFGFFQIINHGIAEADIDDLWRATHDFFAQPTTVKREIMRTKENSRGYYDRELTKNARDLKEVLDISQELRRIDTARSSAPAELKGPATRVGTDPVGPQVPVPELADDDPRNFHRVDGVNQWPDIPEFRKTVLSYLAGCNDVALWLLQAFCSGLGEHADHLEQEFGTDHTSFLRMNHYPLTDVLAPTEAATVTPLGDMALHHHSDSGALTLLLQDDVGGLQVEHEGRWIDVEPLAGALVVNTGDMMQVWSNDRYHAALHRVVPRTDTARYSLPYFFNPSYNTNYSPLPGSIQLGDRPHYRSINWGDFRQARADGDFADYGAEVQITDYLI